MGATRDKVAGKAKERLGKATGDRELESRGKRQHAVGTVKDAAKDVKNKAKDVKKNAKGVKDRVTGR